MFCIEIDISPIKTIMSNLYLLIYQRFLPTANHCKNNSFCAKINFLPFCREQEKVQNWITQLCSGYLIATIFTNNMTMIKIVMLIACNNQNYHVLCTCLQKSSVTLACVEIFDIYMKRWNCFDLLIWRRLISTFQI